MPEFDWGKYENRTPSFDWDKYENPKLAKESNKSMVNEKTTAIPDFLQDAMLGITPAMAGGLLEGLSTIPKGIASTIGPSVPLTKDLSSIPNLKNIFGKPKNEYEEGAQNIAEFVGSLGPYGKLFSALKGAGVAAKIPKFLQNATALGGSGYIATPGESEDKLMGTAAALGLGAGGKIAGKAINKMAPFLRGLTNNSTEQDLINAVQKPHDILSSSADQLYGYVKDEVGKRGVSIPIKEEYLDKAKEILSNTRANKNLIDRAKSGDYDAVHDVQSHLYKKGTKATTSGDIAKEKEGEEILDLRDMMNEDAYNHLIETGNIDIAHALKQGRGVYRELKDTYYNKNLPKGIGKLVHSELRLVPENVTKLFKQNSLPMKEFLEKHPDIEKHIQGLQEKEDAKKALKSMLKYGAAGTAATVVGKPIYDFLNH